MTAPPRSSKIAAEDDQEGDGMYFVVTPTTGNLRRIERAKGESAEQALTRAIAAAAPGDIVAVLRKGALMHVWTGRAEP
jgi:hypothetical protein